MVFFKDKDVFLRFFVDHRCLNQVLVWVSYPIYRMDECIDCLDDAAFFTTPEANTGYWEIKMDNADKDKTTLTSHYGLFPLLRKPLGLKNALGTFQ